MAAKYRAAGFNLYIGLWQGPTEDQLATLKREGMPVICEQNAVGLRHRDDPIIAGWMHGDEPDNAQEVTNPQTGKKEWGPCIPPAKVVDEYTKMKAADPSRPVMLNLGQGVANDAWYGRGNGAKLDDYATYVKGSDLVSFDVYPVAGLGKPDQLGLVGKGIDRLKGWTGGKQTIWNCLECTRIGGQGKATPAQVRAEAWSAIIHGSRGLIYFVHQFEPKFDEHALLDDPEMLAAVTSLNAQIQQYAPLLRAPASDRVSLADSAADLAFASVRKGKASYAFLVSLVDRSVVANLKFAGQHPRVTDVVGKSGPDGKVDLAPYELHIIRFE